MNIPAEAIPYITAIPSLVLPFTVYRFLMWRLDRYRGRTDYDERSFNRALKLYNVGCYTFLASWATTNTTLLTLFAFNIAYDLKFFLWTFGILNTLIVGFNAILALLLKFKAIYEYELSAPDISRLKQFQGGCGTTLTENWETASKAEDELKYRGK